MTQANGLGLKVTPGFDTTNECPDCGERMWLVCTAAQPVPNRLTPLTHVGVPGGQSAKVEGQLQPLFTYKLCMVCQRSERLEPAGGRWKLVSAHKGRAIQQVAIDAVEGATDG